MKIDNAVIFARKFTYIYCRWICFCRDNERQISWLQTSFLHLFSFLGKLPNWGMDTVFLHQIILYALLWSRHTKIFLLVPIVTEMRKVKCFSAILVVSQLVIFLSDTNLLYPSTNDRNFEGSHIFFRKIRKFISLWPQINKLCVIPPLKQSTMTMKNYST